MSEAFVSAYSLASRLGVDENKVNQPYNLTNNQTQFELKRKKMSLATEECTHRQPYASNRIDIVKVIAEEERRNDGYRKLFDMVEVDSHL